jgi:phosphoesterase RecJ-like protein
MVKVIFPLIRFCFAAKFSQNIYFCKYIPKNSPLENTDFAKVSELLSVPRKILITAHTNPDGDAIGASLALYGYFRLKGHAVKVMVPDEYPAFLAWMKYHEEILVFDREPDECLQAIAEAEVLFSVDYNNLDRLRGAAEASKASKAVKVLLDHHKLPAPHFDFLISVIAVSSTAELAYEFIAASGDTELITREIAECIYAGITTDTGSYSYSCNYVRTYEIVADLFRKGIDGEHIHRLVYDTYSESRLRLLGYALSQKLVVLPEFSTAFISLTKEELDKFNYEIGDTEGVVNYALSIDGINLAALFSERDNVIRASFRSKGSFKVDVLAREHFDGGGHKNAAGAYSYVSMDETINKFRALLPQYREQLSSVY